MLLADVFENFRDICMTTYHLDPAYYYTTPGFSFDCMLKYTMMGLELLSDYEMLLMFEKGIRGDLVQVSMRYGKANNLEEKKNYIIYYRNLKQAIANGLILKKVHIGIQFDQSPWLKKYINLNTEMGKKAANNFEKDFYKLMNNVVFGKTMESMRQRIDVQLVLI